MRVELVEASLDGTRARPGNSRPTVGAAGSGRHRAHPG